MSERVTVQETAKILGMSQQGVRIQLQRGKLPIGTAIPSVTGNSWRYLIFRDKLNEFIGKGKESNEQNT